MQSAYEELCVPHVGWLRFPPEDHVLTYLCQSWFEHQELAFVARYLRPGDRVVDCGSHVGLYAILAARLVGSDGRVLALEPSPRTFELLLANIRQNGAANVEARAVALGGAEGTATLSAPEGELAAYSSIDVPTPGASSIEVPVTTADRLLPEAFGDERVAFMKVDVEGHELEVWAGCRACMDRLDVVMVECSRAHLEPSGRSVADLFRAWSADGYHFHRYDAATNTLTRAEPSEDVEWENYFATRDPEEVGRRLAAAPPEQERMAREIERRGRRGFELLKRACDAESTSAALGAEVEGLRAELASVRESAEARLARLARLEPLVVWRRCSRSAALLAWLGRVPDVPREE